jgi:pSer/pThr/pTyr-binding forkhead associated (FHA) protein
MEVRFLFKSSSGTPRVHTKRLPVVIGRSDDADVKLRIPADSVSRRHCEFFLDDSGTVWLRDLGSTNGTLVNGKPLEPEGAVAVTPKSTVKLGTVSFRVEFESAAGAEDSDSDTIPIEVAGPQAEATVGAAAGFPQVPAEDPAVEPAGEGFAPPPAEEESEVEAAAGDGFAFLAAPAEEAAEDEPQWPGAEESPAADDQGLDEFFKGLS